MREAFRYRGCSFTFKWALQVKATGSLNLTIKTDKYLLVVHGTREAVEEAREILRGTQHTTVDVHGYELASK